MGIHRGTPLDPFELYYTFGCGFAEDLFTGIVRNRVEC